ncbi:hypothetical protein EDC01DRAFT_629051 [Geopyxis carbonaria]|nr:hypothetical protein EDC01DRAFT_629051 [Geopyxis carbonaria]
MKFWTHIITQPDNYYKNKYARGGRGRGGGAAANRYDHGSVKERGPKIPRISSEISTHTDLSSLLTSIDRAPYGAYKDLDRHYKWTNGLPIELFVDHIQSDPFAQPSRFHVRLPLTAVGIPDEVYSTKLRTVAFCDYTNRHVLSLVRNWRLDIVAQSGGGFHGPKGGDFKVYEPKQQVLERSSCSIVEDSNGSHLELRFQITLPANGRSISGLKARELLLDHLPRIVDQGMVWSNQNQENILRHIRSVEVQEALRNQLDSKNLVAFIGNGSILPRMSGIDPKPMTGSSIVFKAPDGALETTIDTGVLDDDGVPIQVTGMGIPKGITVISGGGFHGKSTLLKAIELGVYNVVPGDGRELVVTHPQAFKIRAEDGRSVVGTDVSPFINNLPGGNSTSSFSSGDASGSTSMAANIQEALEIGAKLLVIDEDISATNLLVRDVKMERLILRETIEPFVGKVSPLYTQHGVSTVIVVGSCGDYLNVADTVIGMDNYKPEDWSERAKQIAVEFPNAVQTAASFGQIPARILDLTRIKESKGIIAQGTGKLQIRKEKMRDGSYNDDEVDLRYLEQLVEEGQANMCGETLIHMSSLSPKAVCEWASDLETTSLSDLCKVSGWYGLQKDVVRARPLELLATANRFRDLAIKVR